MSKYITIDGGTTNTRLSFVENGIILKTLKLACGARSSMNGESLSDQVRKAIDALTSQYSEPECILAAGMITSEYGLCTVPHIPAPAGVQELHRNMHRVNLAEVSPIPFCFIPGVRTETDMMRGEETELMGLSPQGECTYVLPGSHSKIVQTDVLGRITEFCTCMTGEMAAALSCHTILKDAVNLSGGFCEAALLEGYQSAKELGINRALFQTRLRKTRLQQEERAVTGFFLGCILQAEADTIVQTAGHSIVIAGQKDLKHALCCLLPALTDRQITEISGEDAETASVRGMLRIYESEV